MEPLVTFNHITKRYGSLAAINDISLTLYQGRIIGLLGPNGSGKTTLIKLMNTLIRPDAGDIFIDGEKPGIHSKSMISYLPDKLYFNEFMTVRQLMGYYMDFYADFDQQRAGALLADLSIDPAARINTLSKGTKEKVQLIMVMSRKAMLYILDEPIGGVDPAARDYIIHTIISNYDPQASVIISTHLISDIEAILDDCIFLQNGRVVLYNSAEALRQERNMSIDEIFREVFRC